MLNLCHSDEQFDAFARRGNAMGMQGTTSNACARIARIALLCDVAVIKRRACAFISPPNTRAMSTDSVEKAMRLLAYVLLYLAALILAEIVLRSLMAGTLVLDPAMLWLYVQIDSRFVAQPLAVSAVAALVAAVWLSRVWRTVAAVAAALAVPLAAGWLWAGGYAEALLASGLVLGLLAPRLRSGPGDGAPVQSTIPPVHGSAASATEVRRLLVSAARLGRYPGIEAIEKESRNPALAEPVALGVSREEVLAAARDRRREELRLNLAYLVPALALVVGVAIGAVWIVLPAVAGAGWIAVARLWRDKYRIAPRFLPDAYDAKEASSAIAAPNLVTYRGYYPFSTFGHTFYDICIAVDLARPCKREGYAISACPTRPLVGDMEARVAASLARAEMIEEPLELFFAQGANLPRTLAPRPGGRPPASIDPEHGRSLASLPDSRVRRYMWLRRIGWSGELIVSYFLRIAELGDDLVIELHATYAPPIGREFRFVDTIPPRRFGTDASDLGTNLIVGPLVCLIAPFMLAAHALRWWRRASGAEERELRKAAEDPAFDHGAPASLRSRAARVEGMHYFQVMDRLRAERSFTGRILRECIDYLDECGVDTSELREQRNAIINQGVIVQGGNINATNVAAGVGAKIKQTVAGAVSPSKEAA